MGLKIVGLGEGGAEKADWLSQFVAKQDAWMGEATSGEADDSSRGDLVDQEELEEMNWLDRFVAEQENALPKVTKLTAGMRDHNRVNVFLDGRFAFSLDIAQVVELGVKVGQEIGPERLKELQDASDFGKLYQRTLEWSLTRPHSIRETRNYLRRRQIKRRQLNRQREREEKKPLAEIRDDMMDLVIERLIEKGHLDDKKFAKYYVENRHVRRGISYKRLRMELQKKGISSDTINEVLGAESRDENEEIAKMIAKKRDKYDNSKLVNYLVRQGFNYQMAKEAVEKSCQDENEWMY